MQRRSDIRHLRVPYIRLLYSCLKNTDSPSQPCSIGIWDVSKERSPGVVEDGKKFVYATDVELSAKKFSCVEECKSFFENADVMVMDAQYTAEESLSKENWGHSAFCYAVDFAVAWNIKKLYLFHHEPVYDDRKLSVILDSARLYAGYISKKPVEIFLACEGETIKI